ncbi:NAD-dependent glutamate dehydrogenase [Pleodorina starrii]|uniref:Glycine cleavage system H protein n=1 Tax=Pleodorina starrii TaxID=330485 RepID=A0A9W6C476_9CHLO|nr:NAD-dependent glutamate dehydrogenase [Pleodorina starrii]GLC77805.1 NAD-dependent glutamate dehydrogenase [Pleodorina starrii]GLC77879.1 NAD-dependent glutamate dehydrogenase [Pleodorina starrii]
MALRVFGSGVLGRLGLQAQVMQAAAATATLAYSTVSQGYKYAASHEWASVEGNTATIGISDHAQEQLGDVVYVELPDVGKVVKQGETFGVVESVKAASDVYSPVSGEVVEVNQALVDKPGTVNTSPFEEGWIIKVKMSNKGELQSLLDADAYAAKCEKH